MDKKTIVLKALNQDFLTIEEGLYLFDYLPTPELMWVANEIKKDLHPSNKITWQIDRNVNTTNACNFLLSDLEKFGLQLVIIA